MQRPRIIPTAYQESEDCLALPKLQEQGHQCISIFKLKTAHVAITKALGGDTYTNEFCR